MIPRRALFTLFAGLAFVIGGSRDARARRIRIAIPGYNITQIAFFSAKDKGYFKEEALDVELIQMTGNLANLALMSGEVEFTSVPAAAMAATLRGANLRVLFSTWEKPLFWIFSRAPIRDIKELKGKKIGVPSFNAVTYFLMREYLSRNGLEQGKDYALIQAGDSAPRLLALQSGFVDATILPLPWNFSAQDAGMHEAASLAKADIVAPNGSVVVRDEFLRGEAQLVEQFLRASYKGLRYAVERRAGVIPVLMRNLKIKEDLATRGYDAARPALTADGSFSDDSQKKAVDLVVRSAGTKDTPPAKRFFSFVLAKKVASELQAKGWKPGT